MGKEITLTIDDNHIQSSQRTSILAAAEQAGIYIPRLCFHPDLPRGPGTKPETRVYQGSENEVYTNENAPETPHRGCNICIVEIAGKGIKNSCATLVEEDMVIYTNTTAVKESRRNNLAQIISRHPHACILCASREGCDREECTLGVQKHERCCAKFDNCEFQKVSEYVTIRDDVSRYIFQDSPIVDTALFTMNTNLCLECTRCIRACEKIQGKRIIGFTYHNDKFVWGTLGPSHKESGCVFCGACVEVCPSGALIDKGKPWKKKAKLNLTSVTLPPEDDYEFIKENINQVPEVNGVYQLLNEQQEVILIRGTDNLRRDLLENLESVEKARFFRYEEHGMYTMRENEMVEKYLNKHGKLPEVNDEIADLY